MGQSMRVDIRAYEALPCLFGGRLERLYEVALDTSSGEEAPAPMDLILPPSGKILSVYHFTSSEEKNESAHTMR